MKEMKRERERFENSMGWLIFYWEIAIGIHYYWNWSDNRRCSAMRVLCLCVLCVCRTTILNLTIHCSVVGVVLSQRADRERLCLLILLLLQCSFYVFFLSLSVSYSYSLPFSWFNINLASFSIVLLTLYLRIDTQSHNSSSCPVQFIILWNRANTATWIFILLLSNENVVKRTTFLGWSKKKVCTRWWGREERKQEKRTKRTPIICSNDIRAQLEISYTFGWMALFCLSIPCVAKHTCVFACELSRYFLLRVYLLLFIGIDCVSAAHSIEWRLNERKI